MHYLVCMFLYGMMDYDARMLHTYEMILYDDAFLYGSMYYE